MKWIPTFVTIFLFAACQKTELAFQSSDNNDHTFITIPKGEYKLGAKHHSINPQRTKKLASFLISDTETTNAQFLRFIDATGYITDAEKKGTGATFQEGMIDWQWDDITGANWRFPNGPDNGGIDNIMNHPVTQISYNDALAYCKWLGARLPTLDEWETAARAGSSHKYPWGKNFTTKQANIWNGKFHTKNTGEDGHIYTSPVRSYPPNAFGLYDCIGNVFEYCSDLPQAFRFRNDTETICSGRGGSWWCSANTCSFYNLVDIGSMTRSHSLSNQGFRVAMNIEEPDKH